jgi:hypothetical protein
VSTLAEGADETLKRGVIGDDGEANEGSGGIEALDTSRAEIAEAQIRTFIERRAEKNGEERPEEEAWKESVRTYNAAREAERRAAWADYHKGQALRLRRGMAALVEHHENRARQLLEKGSA